jgi:hypothetical protein
MHGGHLRRADRVEGAQQIQFAAVIGGGIAQQGGLNGHAGSLSRPGAGREQFPRGGPPPAHPGTAAVAQSCGTLPYRRIASGKVLSRLKPSGWDAAGGLQIRDTAQRGGAATQAAVDALTQRAQRVSQRNAEEGFSLRASAPTFAAFALRNRCGMD